MLSQQVSYVQDIVASDYGQSINDGRRAGEAKYTLMLNSQSREGQCSLCTVAGKESTKPGILITRSILRPLSGFVDLGITTEVRELLPL